MNQLSQRIIDMQFKLRRRFAEKISASVDSESREVQETALTVCDWHDIEQINLNDAGLVFASQFNYQGDDCVVVHAYIYPLDTENNFVVAEFIRQGKIFHYVALLLYNCAIGKLYMIGTPEQGTANDAVQTPAETQWMRN